MNKKFKNKRFENKIVFDKFELSLNIKLIYGKLVPFTN